MYLRIIFDTLSTGALDDQIPDTQKLRRDPKPSQKIADLLPEMTAHLGQKVKDQREELFQFWQDLMGEKMSPLTKPISFIDGVLTVKVKSSTLYSLLVTHERPRLLARLQEKFSIRNLIFRVG